MFTSQSMTRRKGPPFLKLSVWPLESDSPADTGIRGTWLKLMVFLVHSGPSQYLKAQESEIKSVLLLCFLYPSNCGFRGRVYAEKQIWELSLTNKIWCQPGPSLIRQHPGCGVTMYDTITLIKLINWYGSGQGQDGRPSGNLMYLAMTSIMTGKWDISTPKRGEFVVEPHNISHVPKSLFTCVSPSMLVYCLPMVSIYSSHRTKSLYLRKINGNKTNSKDSNMQKLVAE